ncbi:hypothetical protein A9255_03580 [Xenorhabdus hominickii]|uniref:Transposase n=1 Tax=Xenorhabdus hominickii TaxID=351679 RepID=A0ABM6DP69_XENHO|nr:hypothetical protein A9255_03580 [Xenorhabdus hominickii]
MGIYPINYKVKQKVERFFLFLKGLEWIETLLMVMTCCLMVYAALEYKIWRGLKQRTPFFPKNMKDKSTQFPMACWVFLSFECINPIIL